MQIPEKKWSKYYTLVLVINLVYIILFFILMETYSN